ncbi:hypothetical protein E2C01_008571 [Portunus trituberculatus]|uniref:Uncharacterized protein n=1 Tax=Portunus trituberculatus TaxID=210409 RepID=A0A5B7D2Q4_PORTR|nr:hypothetical protein [Portunus trituberculatus]
MFGVSLSHASPPSQNPTGGHGAPVEAAGLPLHRGLITHWRRGDLSVLAALSCRQRRRGGLQGGFERQGEVSVCRCFAVS